MIRSGLIGALNNGLIHYSYYKWVDKRFPYHIFSEKIWGPKDGALSKLAVGFTKWAIEWPTIGVYKVGNPSTPPRPVMELWRDTVLFLHPRCLWTTSESTLRIQWRSTRRLQGCEYS